MHILIARGTNEAAGIGGQLAGLTNSLLRNIKAATVEAISYPATAKNPPYDESVRNGVKSVKEQLTDYVENCADARIVLLGYSQGAQIIGDALCGSDEPSTRLSSNIIDHGRSSHLTC